MEIGENNSLVVLKLNSHLIKLQDLNIILIIRDALKTSPIKILNKVVF
jgi:hypothetical protein